MFIFLFIGGGVDYQVVSAQDLGDTSLHSGEFRIFAYGLRHEKTEENIASPADTTYTFFFKSNLRPVSGKLIFYKDTDNDQVHNETIVGEYEIPSTVFAAKNSEGEYSFQLTKADIPLYLTSTDNNAYCNMTWAIELKDDKIVGRYEDATTNLLDNDGNNYTYSSYSTEGGALYKQVREPRRIMIDRKFRCPQGIAIDNNPQSPFFGRVYVANAPTAYTTNLNQNAYAPGIVVYEPNPENGFYRKVGESYMPTGVAFPSTTDEYTRYYMHRIAVNPTNGNVYYAKSTSSYQSAIYQLIPDSTNILTDNGAAINVTSKLIDSNDAANLLHPINSLAFGPGGELYVMSKAGKKSVNDEKSCGTGKIYQLTKTDDDDRYDSYAQYYNPIVQPQLVEKDGKVIDGPVGDPYNVDPWINSNSTMVVNARGGFWVSQMLGSNVSNDKYEAPFTLSDNNSKYAFLAHIHPNGYRKGENPGNSLNGYFQFAMSTVDKETFSKLSLTPKWTLRQFLSPHQQTGDGYSSLAPSGQVAIYEKNGMYSTEAWLAVGFTNKVYVLKLFYNDNDTWFGFNADWMFEIPIGGTIDGLAFDYAGNLFIASASAHTLYAYSLPNYGSSKTNPAVQPLVFDEDGARVTEFRNDESVTNASNNLNRGFPLDDNCIVTPARFELKVDGAIVYDKNYNTGTFDTQWSTENNWNIKRVPDATDIPVIVRSDAVLDEKQAASGVTIENSSRLTIAHNGGLTVGEGGIAGASKSGSSIVIENFSTIHPGEKEQGAGYLRIHPDVTDMPKVTVHYQTKSQPSESSIADRDRLWQYVGAPGEGTIARSTAKTWLYKWVEAKGWVKKESTDAMRPFTEGYAITQEGAPDYWWTAKAINANQDIPMSYTNGATNVGQNIFVNSYLAPINVSAFVDNDFSGSIEKTFYLFNTGSWNEWHNAATGQDSNKEITENQSPGQYSALPVNSAQNFDSSKDPVFIPPMSGVFVVARDENASIHLDYERLVWTWKDNNAAVNNPMRVPQFITQSSKLLRRIRIQAYGANSGSDRLYIFQDSRCTAGYDNGWDGLNWEADGQVGIYTNEPSGKMEVSASDYIDSMYIGFRTGADTVYTLRFSSLIGDSLYIKDMVADSIIALVDDATYSFTAPANSVNDMRFQVQLNPEFPIGHPNNGNNGTTTAVDDVVDSKIWILDDVVYIATGLRDNTVILCNINGQVLQQQSFNHQVQLSVQGLPAGVYLLKVNDEVYKFVGQD